MRGPSVSTGRMRRVTGRGARTVLDDAADEAAAGPARRAWWQRVPVLVAVGVVPVPFGLYFLGFIAIAMLLSDRTRETPVKAGGAVALFWWAYSFRQGDTSPFVAAPLLVVAAVLFGQSFLARRRGDAEGPAWVPAAAAAGAAAMAVVAFVPYGYRSAEISREDAVRRVVAERAARPWHRIAAASYLVEGGRARLVHTPEWFVALYEKNPTVARTADGQTCFSRREVWRVNGLDGAVARVTFDDAASGDEKCLPLRVGTEQDLRPVPG